jgi:hypothetical protein
VDEIVVVQERTVVLDADVIASPLDSGSATERDPRQLSE